MGNQNSTETEQTSAPVAPPEPRYSCPAQAQSVPTPLDQPPAFWADTLQQPVETVPSRWSALQAVASPRGELLFTPAPHLVRQHPPVLAVFSLAGGVGKTGIVATLGSALVARGENVLLVDTNSYGLLPLYYGVRDVRHGAVRTFSAGESDAAVQLLSLQPDSGAPVARWKDRKVLADKDRAVLADKDSSPIADEVIEGSRHADRVIVDLATASVDLARQILSLTPRVLVPLLPDVSSLAGVQAVESFFSRMSQAEGRFVEPFYILNSFDASLPLHVEMRATLQATLGNRLLSFVLRRTPAVAEALAEGMTVIEFAPDQPIAEDYARLASWINDLAAPTGNAFRPKRWNDLSPE